MTHITAYIRENHVLATVLVVFVAWLVWFLGGVLILLLLAFILMATIYPVVELMKRKKVPHVLAVLIPFLVFIGLVGGGIALLVKPVISEVESLSVTLPGYIDRAIQTSGLDIDVSGIRGYAIDNLGGIGQGLLSVTSAVAGGLFGTLMVIAISIYLLMDREKIVRFFASCFPRGYRERIPGMFERIVSGIGAWARGQLLISIIVALCVWLLLVSLGVPYAILWALLAGMLDPIPFIGPIIASVPAIVIALSVSPSTALLALIGFFVIQQVQAFVFAPMVMEKTVGLHPLMVIVGVLVGGALGGLAGAFLAVPLLVIGRLALKS